VHAGPDGLTTRQAAARRRVHGANVLADPPAAAWARDIGKRLANPLVLVLLAASAIAALTGDAITFGFVILVVLLSITLDMVLEHRAGRAVEALRRGIALPVTCDAMAATSTCRPTARFRRSGRAACRRPRACRRPHRRRGAGART